MAKAAYPTIGIAALVMFGIVYFIGCLLFFTLLCHFRMIEDVIGNSGNLVVQFLIGFGLECYYFHNGN